MFGISITSAGFKSAARKVGAVAAMAITAKAVTMMWAPLLAFFGQPAVWTALPLIVIGLILYMLVTNVELSES